MNWGTKIVLGMAVFMLFIIGMVAYMFSQHDKDALVVDDYYEKGINYDETYNASLNTFTDHAVPKIETTKTQIIITFKNSVHYKLILMRPSNKANDLTFEGLTIGAKNLVLINRTHLPKGPWFLNLQWMMNEKKYLFKTNITL